VEVELDLTKEVEVAQEVTELHLVAVQYLL
jgi:hypothetical protein